MLAMYSGIVKEQRNTLGELWYERKKKKSLVNGVSQGIVGGIQRIAGAICFISLYSKLWHI